MGIGRAMLKTRSGKQKKSKPFFFVNKKEAKKTLLTWAVLVKPLLFHFILSQYQYPNIRKSSWHRWQVVDGRLKGGHDVSHFRVIKPAQFNKSFLRAFFQKSAIFLCSFPLPRLSWPC
jgi:hypothetical protein